MSGYNQWRLHNKGKYYSSWIKSCALGSAKVFCRVSSRRYSAVPMPLSAKPLTRETWPAFARLVEKHNGIFGGCWCISFHLEPGEKRHGAETYRAMKKALVQ